MSPSSPFSHFVGVKICTNMKNKKIKNVTPVPCSFGKNSPNLEKIQNFLLHFNSDLVLVAFFLKWFLI
jgi:hypothetical protein